MILCTLCCCLFLNWAYTLALSVGVFCLLQKLGPPFLREVGRMDKLSMLILSFLQTVWFLCFQRCDSRKKDSHVSEHLREIKNRSEQKNDRNTNSLTFGDVRLNDLHFFADFHTVVDTLV